MCLFNRPTLTVLFTCLIFPATTPAAGEAQNDDSADSMFFFEAWPLIFRQKPAGPELQDFQWRDYYRVEHYTVHARLDENEPLLKCRAILALEYLDGGLETVDFMFGTSLAQVDSVKRKGEPLEFDYYQRGYYGLPTFSHPFLFIAVDSLVVFQEREISAGDRDTLTIFYSTNLVHPYPQDSTYYGEIGERSLFSSYGHWHPALPETQFASSVYDIYLDLPAEYEVAGMGEIVSQEASVGRKITHFHAEGGAARGVFPFAAGDYERFETEHNGIPVSLFVFEEHTRASEGILEFVKEILPYLENLFGVPYELPSLQIVERDKKNVPSTAAPGIIFLDSTIVSRWEYEDYIAWDERKSREVIVHELAHQWWGINIYTESDFWIIEGFAVLAELFYMMDYQGEEALARKLEVIRSLYIGNALLELNHGTAAEFDTSRASHDLYYRAPWLLWKMREKLGPDLFGQVVRSFLAENQYIHTNTGDWQEICERFSGEDLTEFFDKWYYNFGIPRLHVRWEYLPESSGLPLLVVTVSQLEPFFELDLDFEAYLESGEILRETRTVSGESTAAGFRVPSPVDSVAVDPENLLLAWIEYPVRIRMTEFGNTPNSTYPYPVDFYIDSLLQVVSLSIHYAVDSSETIEISGYPGDLVSGSGLLEIPVQSEGSLVEYYLEFLDDNGVVHRYPDAAPEKKYAFRITRPPQNLENLLVSSKQDNELFLYDLSEQRVVGEIRGACAAEKFCWSPDGTLVLAATGKDKNCVSLIDVFNFRLIFKTCLGHDIREVSRPVITPDNRYAFVPIHVSNYEYGESGGLLRLDLASGTVELTKDFPLYSSVQAEPLYLPKAGQIAVCSFYSDPGGNPKIHGSSLLYIDPEKNAVVDSLYMIKECITAFQTDSTEKRFFLTFNKSSVAILSGEPLQTEFRRDYYCIDSSLPPPLDKIAMELSFLHQAQATPLGVMVYQSDPPSSYKCFGHFVYWDTKNRDDPLGFINLMDVYPYSLINDSLYLSYITPAFTISPDGRKLWFYADPGAPGIERVPGLIQFDLGTKKFLETIPITGLGKIQYLGYFSAYQQPGPFISYTMGDINADGKLNIFDLLAFLQAYKEGSPDITASPEMDVDGNGAINILDLLALLELLVSIK